MIQQRDDKKKQVKEFKLKSLMIDFDEYLRIFILPQIPTGYADLRASVRETMDAAWSELFFAAMTSKRVRQSHLIALKVNLAKIETYLQEVRDICYRKKEKKKMDAISERRFNICAKKCFETMNFVWGWISNEAKALDASKSDKTTGLVEKEEVN